MKSEAQLSFSMTENVVKIENRTVSHSHTVSLESVLNVPILMIRQNCL